MCKKLQFIPWPGKLPQSFKQTRGALIGKLVSCRDALVGDALTSIVILELLLELWRLQYPLETLRALIHSIPPSRPIVLARGVIREFARYMRRVPNFPKFGGRGGDRGRGQRGRDRRRRREDSSSSSSSVDVSVRTARKILYRRDAKYRASVKREEEQAREEEWARHGKILADAVAGKFDEAIKANQVTPSTEKPPEPKAGFPPQPPHIGGGSGSAGPGFSDLQMATLRELMGQAAPPPAKRAKAPPAEEEEDPEGPVTPLQKSFILAHFGGKVMCKQGTLAEFKKEIDKKWNPKVVAAIGSFIKTHKPDVDIPKAKAARAQLFWTTLRSLD